MAKKNKLKVLNIAELQERFQICKEEGLCFISKEPLAENTTELKHPELGNVQVNSVWL